MNTTTRRKPGLTPERHAYAAALLHRTREALWGLSEATWPMYSLNSKTWGVIGRGLEATQGARLPLCDALHRESVAAGRQVDSNALYFRQPLNALTKHQHHAEGTPPGFTLEAHRTAAVMLKILRDELAKLAAEVGNVYPYTSKMFRKVDAVWRAVDAVRSALDGELARETSGEQWRAERLSAVYYPGSPAPAQTSRLELRECNAVCEVPKA